MVHDLIDDIEYDVYYLDAVMGVLCLKPRLIWPWLSSDDGRYLRRILIEEIRD